MEELIERLMMCGLTRMQAKGVCRGFSNMADLRKYVEAVEKEYRQTGQLACL